MYFYKFINDIPKIGSIIDTDNSIDFWHIHLTNKLNRLFNLLYNLSHETDLPIINILSLIYPDFFVNEKFEPDKNLLDKIEILKTEISKSNFMIYTEFKFFNYFILEKVRQDIYKENGVILPNRIKSSYFFESLSDLKKYCSELNINHKIIKVEFVEIRQIAKMDNRLIVEFHNDYTSKDFYNQAKKFLTKNSSANPLFEIIFQGKYKVISILDEI